MKPMLACLLVLATFHTIAQEPVSKWTPELQMKIKTPGSPTVSPDGKYVAYIINSAVMTDTRSEYNSQIWLSTTDGKSTRQLTTGDKSCTNPQWSPDSKYLAFTSTRNNNRNNIFLLNIESGETRALTDLKGSVSFYRYSPASNVIVFSMADGKTEKEEIADKGKTDYKFIDENIKYTRLYLLNIDTALTAKTARLLTPGNFNSGSFNFSPDGKKIAFAKTLRPGQNYVYSSDIALIDLNSLNITEIAASPLPEMVPYFSPDGKIIAYLAGRSVGEIMINRYELRTISPSGGTAQIWPVEFDGRTTLFSGFGEDGKYYFAEARSTGLPLFSFDFKKRELKEIPNKGIYFHALLNSKGNYFALVNQAADKAPEVFVTPLSDFKPLQVSKVNTDLPNLPLGHTENIKWKSKDGKEIEGLLTYPVNYRKGDKVPLLLLLHGGPNGVFQNTFLPYPDEYPVASFASEGFAVLRPNPRGSNGYGAEFRRANMKDWGGGDYDDVMTGVDKLIQMGVADSTRMGVMGWSYGGYLTAWIVTHSKRFKAASAGAAPVNMSSLAGTTDFPLITSQYLGNEYWDDPAIYQKVSPISFVKGVTTPVLIQQGEVDIRIPPSQAYEFYYALKQQNVPVRLMMLPRQGHNITEPKMLLATMETNLEWFKKYLGKPTY